MNLITKLEKNLYFMEEFPKMALTNGKVRKYPNETLSHGVPVMVKIALLGIPVSKRKPDSVQGLSENSSKQFCPSERCLQTLLQSDNPMSSPS